MVIAKMKVRYFRYPQKDSVTLSDDSKSLRDIRIHQELSAVLYR